MRAEIDLEKKHRTVCLFSCLHDINDSHTKHYARVLVRNGYSVLTIRPGKMDSELKGFSIDHRELSRIDYHFWPEGTPLRHVAKAVYQRFLNTCRAARHLWQLRPCLVMCMEPDSILLAVLLKPLLKHKVIADLRELYEDRLLALPAVLRGVFRAPFRAAMRLMSGFVDEIVHVSEERKKEYSYLKQPGVVVVYYPEFPADIRPMTPVPSGIVALHAGSLRNSYAGNELLLGLRLARLQIPSLTLVVLGSKLQPLIQESLLEAMVKEGAVWQMGNIPSGEVARYMMAAHIGINLVLPVDRTHYLAQPRKLYEYLHAGVPVVGSNVPTIRRVLETADAGLVVDASDPRQIAEALVQLSSNETKRARMAANARRAAAEYYNWPRQEGIFLGMFERVSGPATVQ